MNKSDLILNQSKKIMLLTIMILFGVFISSISSCMQVFAATNEYNFDFGEGKVQEGYIGVSASDAYDSKIGYGFNTIENVANVSASGSNELSDAVQFKTTDTNNTFNVDLDNGLYEVTVHLGDTMRTSIYAEGCLQIINMTGNNATDTVKIPVTDGQLNIMATAGKVGYPYSISSLNIKKISDDPTMKPTIWICGDSTVCNYYPIDSSTQAGWGQMLYKYVDTDKWQIRNMASGGQYAKGFVTAGQFATILKYGKPGDVYFISIGINDTNYSNADEYYETVSNMAKQAMEKGMKVILVKQQGRATDISRNPLLTGRWFGTQLDRVGSELNLQVIDLFNLAQDYYLSIGQEATTSLYIKGDTLHPNRNGASILAKLVSEQVDLGSKRSEEDEKIYYAVNAKYEDGVIEKTNLGYTGDGYINLDNKEGSSITWDVNVKTKGNYLVTFRVANGSANDRAMKIQVNDNEDYWIQPFTSTGSFTAWQERGIVLPLKSGENTIKATSNMYEGGPNIDYIKLELTDEPIAEVYKEDKDNKTDKDGKFKVYIAGDSTVQSYNASYKPQQGWGYYLKDYLDNNIVVENHAIAGRSSKSFYDNGRLDTILKSIKKDDYLLIQFGINDSAYNKPERYAPVCGKVEDAEEGSFEYYIKKYVEGALDKDATPVLISPTLGLKAYSDGKFENSYTDYSDAMQSIAEYYNIPFIDLNSKMVELYNDIGYDAAAKYHLYGVVDGSKDMTHFSEKGAKKVASLVAEDFMDIVNGETDKKDENTDKDSDKDKGDVTDNDKDKNDGEDKKELDIKVTEETNVKDNIIYQKYTIKSNKEIDLSKLKIVYKAENLPSEKQKFWCDSGKMTLKVSPWYLSLRESTIGTLENGELTITNDSENKLRGENGEAKIGIHFAKDDWSNYEDIGKESIEVYYDGVLVK